MYITSQLYSQVFLCSDRNHAARHIGELIPESQLVSRSSTKRPQVDQGTHKGTTVQTRQPGTSSVSSRKGKAGIGSETSAGEMLNIVHVTQPNAIHTNTTHEAAAQSAILIQIQLSGNPAAIAFINSSRFFPTRVYKNTYARSRTLRKVKQGYRWVGFLFPPPVTTSSQITAISTTRASEQIYASLSESRISPSNTSGYYRHLPKRRRRHRNVHRRTFYPLQSATFTRTRRCVPLFCNKAP